MRQKNIILSIVAAFLLVTTFSARAVIVTVNQWSYIDGIGDTGTTLFEVTETFTSAAELGGTENLYEYSVRNLTSDLSARLFRVDNPDNLSRTMTGPTNWNERLGAPNFIWETANAVDYIDPGETLSGFEIRTTGLIPELTSPPFLINQIGWIEARDLEDLRVDIFGPVSHAGVVPVPAAVWLFGTALVGLAGFGKRRKAA